MILVHAVHNIELTLPQFDSNTRLNDSLSLQRYMMENKEEQPWNPYSLRSDTYVEVRGKGISSTKEMSG